MKQIHDNCGVVGVYGPQEAANLAYLGLYALQHRGQESAGIVSSDGHNMGSHRSMGLVQDVFNNDIIKRLKGHIAIGHVRYSTAGASLYKNVQPFAIESTRGRLAVAHNGNLVNARDLRMELEQQGSIFQSSLDTEVIVHLLQKVNSDSLLDKMAYALGQIQGAFSLVFITEKQLAAARDPWGFRPLVLGELEEGFVVASETCALDLIDAKLVREIEPGEVVIIDKNGVQSHQLLPPQPVQCIFELIYFARPDSVVFGESVYESRIRLGRQLAIEQPADADIVIAVPDSGRHAAMGYARQSGLLKEDGLVRNHYVGRTFIEPRQSIRHFGVKLKLNAVREVLKGKRVVVVDDSIVRGTTCHKIVSMIREQGGAKEVHFRVSAPPLTYPCYYGIDIPTRKELIYNERQGSIESINEFITSDSLGYISVPGMWQAITQGRRQDFCDACFTGNYPIEPPDSVRKRQMELFIHEVSDRS